VRRFTGSKPPPRLLIALQSKPAHFSSRGEKVKTKNTIKIRRFGIICFKCRIEAKPTKIKFKGKPFDGWRCGKCGEEIFDSLQAKEFLSANKKKRHAAKRKARASK
jgi:hypothetical protein